MWSGDFEVHLTCPARKAVALARFAEQHGAKFSHIELDQGVAPSQPMLTVFGSGTWTEIQRLAAHWRAGLEAAGLRVLRAKIEAALWNDGVPELDEHARAGLYFEHHVKVRLPPGDERVLGELTSAVRDHGARPSRNARRVHTEDWEDRFVTQRCHGVGRRTATGRLDALLTAVRIGGFEVLEVQQEYVVHDDAAHLDTGWLEREPARGSAWWQ
ncbi:hypothetical protein I6A84_01700 [Frankia sp. CNm7]|uniref:Ankyrin n=1 Tax=Frankia nepalensis TaxID=1836974 RepID=A0A937UNG2_9ACTN|nr:hypothetical protein [Frankia nepalensis]MBL7498144.1 hypothetical protein [Frankia nepalensis]MBL7509338.1 hypothetical protein [Frankia nepalensis]MBL7516874.1 hypothetical protein [Frankia nepalensis]MBL7627932.1 hypothetical protein [Frankia nepalensis]